MNSPIQINKKIGRIYGCEDWRNWTVESQNVVPLSGEYVVEMYEGPSNSHEVSAPHEDKNKLIGLVRDPIGMMPVYYTLQNGLKVFYSLKDAKASLKKSTVNWEYIYSVLAINCTHFSESPYEEIFRLPPGHLLFQKNGQWITRPYFQELKPHRVSDFRELFIDVVNERANQHPDFSLFFSGGLDSSLILASMLKRGFLADAVTLSFSDGMASEERALSAFEKRWPNSFTRVIPPPVNTNEYDMQPGENYFYFATETLFNPLIKYTKQKNASHIWMGYGADEVFTLNTCLLCSLLLSGEIKEFVTALKQDRSDGKSVTYILNSIFKEFAPLSVRKLLTELVPPPKSDLPIPQVSMYMQEARRNRQKRVRPELIQNELYERLFHSGTIAFAAEQSHEITHPLNLNYSYPYLDLRLIQHSLSLNANEFYQQGLNKFILRDSFRDLLPPEITDSNSRQTYDDWQAEVLLHQMQSLQKLIEASSHKKYFPEFDAGSWNSKFLIQNIRPVLKLLYSAQFEMNSKEGSVDA